MNQFSHLPDELRMISRLVSSRKLDTLDDCIELVRDHQKFFVMTYTKMIYFYDHYLKNRDDQGGYKASALYPWGYKGRIEDILFLVEQFAFGSCKFGGYYTYKDPSGYDWEEMANDLDKCFSYHDRYKMSMKSS